MKRIVVFLVSCYLLLVTCYRPSFAQDEEEPIPIPTEVQEEISPTILPAERLGKSKIDELKEKIASTVAQLNLVSKKAFVGEIVKLEKNRITLERYGDTRIIDVDELSKYISVDKDGKRAEKKFSDLDVGNWVVTIGLYNKESQKLLSRFLLIKEIQIRLIGIVREVDIKGGTITVEDKKMGKTMIVDIEKATIIRTFTKGEGLVKSGLSKIEIGQRAYISGIVNKEQENRIAASKILLLPGKAANNTNGNSTKPTTSVQKKDEAEIPSPTEETTPTPKPTRKVAKLTPTPPPTE